MPGLPLTPRSTCQTLSGVSGRHACDGRGKGANSNRLAPPSGRSASSSGSIPRRARARVGACDPATLREEESSLKDAPKPLAQARARRSPPHLAPPTPTPALPPEPAALVHSGCRVGMWRPEWLSQRTLISRCRRLEVCDQVPTWSRSCGDSLPARGRPATSSPCPHVAESSGLSSTYKGGRPPPCDLIRPQSPP